MKLLICDVEGTLFKANYRIDGTHFASTMWQPIAQKLGDGAIEEEKASHNDWEENKFKNYTQWVKATFEIHKKYNLRKRTFNELIDSAEYADGVVEFFNQLDTSKYIPVLISGGFQELIKRAQRELRINYGYGACEYIFDENTGRLIDCSLTPCDFEGKYHYIESLFEVYDLDKKTDWIFIGDGKNDVHIAGIAPRSFGVKPHPELANVVTHVVDDFKQIKSMLEEDEDIIYFSKMAILPDAVGTDIQINIEEYNKLTHRVSSFQLQKDFLVSNIKRLEDEVKVRDILLVDAEKKENSLAETKLLLEQALKEKNNVSSELEKNQKAMEKFEDKTKAFLENLYNRLTFSRESIKSFSKNTRMSNNTLLKILLTLNNGQRKIEGVRCRPWKKRPNEDIMEYYFSDAGRVLAKFDNDDTIVVRDIVFHHEHA